MKTENNKNSVIALDVGGSSVKSGLVKSDGLVDFVCHTPINSQASKEKVLRVFAEIIQTYLPKVNPNEFLGIAIGFPGPFDYENGLCHKDRRTRARPQRPRRLYRNRPAGMFFSTRGVR